MYALYMSVCVRYVCAFVVLKTCEGYVCVMGVMGRVDGCVVCIRRVVSRRMMGLDGRPTRAIRGVRARDVDREDVREGCVVVLRSRRGGGVRADSIRFDSIRFDSIRFDSIRFIHSFIRAVIRRRRWIGLDWIGLDDAGRWVDDVLVDVRVRVRDGERWDGGGTRDAETRAARVSRAPRAREDRRRRRR